MTSAPIGLPALSGQQAQAWDALMSVAGSLGEGWTLIGGQMVLLHQSEVVANTRHRCQRPARSSITRGFVML